MFGYIRPQKSELLVKDYDAYRAVYCSLCRQLGKSYGFCASLILSYDSTFYAILAMSVRGECNSYKKGRCKVNPTKRCDYCSSRSKSLEDAAALSIAAFYYKLEDDRRDEGFFKRLAVRLVKPFAKRWRKKMIKYGYSDFDMLFSDMLKNQLEAEQDSACSVDRAAEPTAKALAQAARMLSNGESQRRVLESLGYYLGKWIYLMDAADDLEDDLKRGGFNPFINHLSLDSEPVEDLDAAVYERINEIINENAFMLLSSFNLIELMGNRRILENIVTLGVSSMQKAVLFDKKAEKSKNKDKSENDENRDNSENNDNAKTIISN